MRGLVGSVPGGLDFDRHGRIGCRVVSSRQLLGGRLRFGLEKSPVLGGLGGAAHFLRA